MTIKDCIDIVDNLKPNQYTIKDKVMWLSFIERIIINEVLKTHEGYDGRYDDFEGYSEDRLSVPLIVPFPYDKLYTAYLKMKIDEENGEVARYNNSMIMYNTYMMEYRKHYNKTHMPLDATSKRNVMPQKKVSVGLSDAEYENLKKDMTYILTEYFSDAVSPDKLTDIVTKFMQTNINMLKGKDGRDGADGKDGYTPRKGIDYFDGKKGDKGAPGKDGANGHTPQKGVEYWTDEDKAEITDYIDEQTAIIKTDIQGIQEDIQNEAHFRGYLSTNAKIQSLVATPNDFAYSAESGTKWVYDEVSGWVDSGSPVPDQLTPASDTTPLINGEASVGKENAYARGDHRHPTDTTRASVAELNMLSNRCDELEVKMFYYGDIDFLDIEIRNKTEHYCGLISDCVNVVIYGANAGFMASLYFSTPTSIPENYSQFPETIKFKGDSVVDSRFVPEANMRYSIVFSFDGYMMNGYVSGVTQDESVTDA